MRALGLLLWALIGAGLLAGPAKAEPCPLHGVEQVRIAGVPHNVEAREVAVTERHWTFGAGAVSSPSPPERAGSHHSVPDGQSCCHAVGDTTLAAFGLAGDSFQPLHRRPHVAGWLRPHALSAADIFRPPRFT